MAPKTNPQPSTRAVPVSVVAQPVTTTVTDNAPNTTTPARPVAVQVVTEPVTPPVTERSPQPTTPSHPAVTEPVTAPTMAQLTLTLDPPRPPSMTPDLPQDVTVPVAIQPQVQYAPVRIRALPSTNLQPTSAVIAVLQGYVIAQQPNVLLIADETGIAIVNHTKGSFTGVTGVSIHFNGGVTVSTNTHFYPVLTLMPTATIKRANIQRVDITPFLTTNPMERRQQEGHTMLLHLTNRVASSRTCATNFLAQTQTGEAFVLTPFGALIEKRLPNGFYMVVNMRKSQSKQGTKVYFYADSQNGAAMFPTDVIFPLSENPTRIDLPPSQTIHSIPEAFNRIDPHALFTFHGATVTGFSYTQPSTQGNTQGKRFQRVTFFLGNGGHSSTITIFEEKTWLPETTVTFNVHFVRQNTFGGQCNFQTTDASEFTIVTSNAPTFANLLQSASSSPPQTGAAHIYTLLQAAQLHEEEDL